MATADFILILLRTHSATIRCHVCQHTATIRAALMDELRATGGDGPYCRSCHDAGRPDSLMVEDPAASPGVPGTSGTGGKP